MKEYIERESLQDDIRRLSMLITGLRCGKGVLNEYMKQYRESILRIVDEQPTADVQEVRSGHWILLRESEITGFNPEFAGRDPIGGYQCSNCKEVAILDCNDEFVLSRYCPHCGSKMDGEREEGNDNG